MHKIPILLLLTVLSIRFPLILTASDTLHVYHKEVINYQVSKLSKDLELSEQQKESIQQILEAEKGNRLKLTPSTGNDLPPYFTILNASQQDKWLRYFKQDNESSPESSTLKSTGRIESEHVLELGTKDITDVRVIINNHIDGAHSENTNYSTYSRTCAVAWTYRGALMFCRSYMHFALDAIPAGSTIVNATLYLYSDPKQSSPSSSDANSTLSGSNAMYIERATENWEEKDITWNTQPATTPEGRVLVNQSSSPTENVQLNLTGMVQYWVNSPWLNHGVKLQLQTEVRYRGRNYASTDHSNVALRPKLVIYYNESHSNIEYTYDSAGNRLSRQTIVLRSLKSSSRKYQQAQTNYKPVTKAFELKESLEESNIVLYPNPTQENLNIQFDKVPNAPVHYFLNDLTGARRLQGKILDSSLKTLQLGELPPGVYLLTLKQGTTSVSYKIIKQ